MRGWVRFYGIHIDYFLPSVDVSCGGFPLNGGCPRPFPAGPTDCARPCRSNPYEVAVIAREKSLDARDRHSAWVDKSPLPAANGPSSPAGGRAAPLGRLAAKDLFALKHAWLDLIVVRWCTNRAASTQLFGAVSKLARIPRADLPRGSQLSQPRMGRGVTT
jgi:hypothetical protein